MAGEEYFIPSEAERTRLENLRAQQQALVDRISVLERFNGLQFVTVGATSVTTGQGNIVHATTAQQSGGGSGSTGTGCTTSRAATRTRGGSFTR